MNAAELLFRCLEHEGVQLVFGLPGEETPGVDECAAGFPHAIYRDAARLGTSVHGRCL